MNGLKTYRADFVDGFSLLRVHTLAESPEIVNGEDKHEDHGKQSHLDASKHAFKPVDFFGNQK